MRLLKPGVKTTGMNIQHPTEQANIIFATHNANIPVLGDAENVCACEYSDGKIQTVGGGVDAPLIQQHIISVMEGGREAFERRREVYGSWLSKT